MIKRPAKGVTGFLIYNFDGGYCFRVYEKDYTFTDYDLKHCDLEVTILDDDATFYDHGGGRFSLDHSFEMGGN